MDFIPEWAHHMLNNYLPLFRTYTSTLDTLRKHLQPALASVTTAPDLATLALLLIILFLSLKILDMLRRAVLFWLSLALRAVTWAAVIFGVFWVASRGVDGAIQDVEYWIGVFMGEWKRWEDRADLAREWERQRTRGFI